MAHDLGPKCRLCRREGLKLFLKRRALPHREVRRRAQELIRRASTGAAGSSRASTCRASARSRRRAATTASSSGSSARRTRRRVAAGAPGENLLRMLETRLDNVVYRLGFAGSRAQGASCPSWALPGQRPPREHPELRRAAGRRRRAEAGQPGGAYRPRRDRPDRVGRPRLQADHDGPTGTVLKWPERDEIDAPVQESLIVELTRSSGAGASARSREKGSTWLHEPA